MAQRSADREAIEAEVDRVRSLGLDALRSLWRTTLRSSPPPAFTKDLMARFLCWHIQEQALGGLDPRIAKLLDDSTRGERPLAERRLKPGTVLVREYQGERYTVTIVPGGYIWHEVTYASLSTIARAITGTTWNGPRFFGLRTSVNHPKDIEPEQGDGHTRAPNAKRSGMLAASPAFPENGSDPEGGNANDDNGKKARSLRDLHPQIDRA
jgi:hypothetical protein